ncbi:MAG: deoxyribodipyrimidine photo-lyase [Candidatus Thermoplasmatota archaeon]|nr:deoxyribodipyrimidine photo-lyase [Candidatus Thermoplasmatota archaeon]
MQASQRTLHNHALQFAVSMANGQKLPLVVFFGIDEDYPQANERHFKFMLEGLSEVQNELERIDTRMVVRRVEPWKGALALSREARIAVCDKGYLKHQRDWRRRFAGEAECTVVEVESDVIVPVGCTGGKERYSAAVLRPKIHALMDGFMMPPDNVRPTLGSLDLSFEGLDLADSVSVLKGLWIDRSVHGVDRLEGGTYNALQRFRGFLRSGLDLYGIERNDPSRGIQSDMAPYLHFGQISPLTLALEANEAGSPGTEAFLEELIVRRELAVNFVSYNDRYDTFECLPRWASDTLMTHSMDLRKYTYDRKELEEGRTHDPYWNAAQKEMVVRGKMHNYMRMYWGKKILEWVEDPREAFSTALDLNNKYSLDGRDPNSYAGVAWCFGKHDRPWSERPIFGKVRYMNDKGLKRKFDMEAYVSKVSMMGG